MFVLEKSLSKAERKAFAVPTTPATWSSIPFFLDNPEAGLFSIPRLPVVLLWSLSLGGVRHVVLFPIWPCDLVSMALDTGWAHLCRAYCFGCALVVCHGFVVHVRLTG